MKTSVKVLIIVLALASVLLLGFLWEKSATNTTVPDQHFRPSPTPEILENGWYRFTDKKAGYSFDYQPDLLSISTGKNKGEEFDHLTVQFSSIHEYGYQGMFLYIIPNPERLSVDEFLLKEFRGLWNMKLPPENLSKMELGEFLKINGHAAIKTTLPVYVEIESAPFCVYIENGNKIIATSPFYGLMSAMELAPGTEELFMQILATFKFDS